MLRDPDAAVPVTKAAKGVGAEGAGEGLAEAVADGSRTGAGEEGVAGGDGLGAIGDGAGDDGGDTEEGGFFLDAAGVGEDGKTRCEKLLEYCRGQGWEPKDIGWQVDFDRNLLDIRIRMYGPQELDRRMGSGREG